MAFIVFLLGTWHFHAVFGGSWLDAVYFVVTTMTTTGYGDLTPDRNNPVDIVAAMLLMLSGITLTGLFIAFGASLLTRVHWVTLQGLRPVHHRGHIIACGAGSIGSNVIDLLLGLGKRLVVVEISPDTAIIEQAREQRFDLLTGKATGSTPIAAAISSMKDSLANWICGPTRSRRCAVRSGEARSSKGAIVSQARRLFAKP